MAEETSPTCFCLPRKFTDIIRNFLSENNVTCHKVCIQRRNKTLLNADFLVLRRAIDDLNECLQHGLKKTILQRCIESGIPIHSIEEDKDKNLVIKLDRSKCYSRIIKSVIETKEEFGSKKHLDNIVLLNCCDFFRNTPGSCPLPLSMLRSLIILQHLHGLLKSFGYRVKCIPLPLTDSLNSILEKFDLPITLIENKNVGPIATNIDHYIRKCQQSQYSEKVQPNNVDDRENNANSSCGQSQCSNSGTRQKYSELSGNECNSLLMNLRKFIEDNNLPVNKNGYFKDLCFTQVLHDGRPTKCLEQVISLDESLKKFSTENASFQEPQVNRVTCIHVVSERNLFTQQQAGLLWGYISERTTEFEQLYLPYGSVVTKTENECDGPVSAEEFYRHRFKQLEDAAIIKYGEAVKGIEWNKTISSLTNASMKFDLLSNGCRNNVKLNFCEAEDEGFNSEYRAGAFVMYNCARLATLFTHFDGYVQKGKYPPLPDLDNIDFSLLREEDEWSLFFNYVLQYTETIENCIDLSRRDGDIYAHVHTHKISNFLINLSRNLSSYYSRIHILVEPHEHLLGTMYARIYLLKAVHQVMKNGLHLMRIQPSNQL